MVWPAVSAVFRICCLILVSLKNVAGPVRNAVPEGLNSSIIGPASTSKYR